MRVKTIESAIWFALNKDIDWGTFINADPHLRRMIKRAVVAAAAPRIEAFLTARAPSESPARRDGASP